MHRRCPGRHGSLGVLCRPPRAGAAAVQCAAPGPGTGMGHPSGGL